MDVKSKRMRIIPSIKEVAVHVPSTKMYTSDILAKIEFNSGGLTKSTLERLLGNTTRFFADQETQVSDLACLAAEKVLQKFTGEKVDLLIFAAASSDLIEPATANIIQSKLGLHCPVMDIKNACNSMVSAIHTASAFIEAKYYNNVLIVNGEKLSEVINFRPKDEQHLLRCIASYGLGDAGAAILMGSDEGSKIFHQKFSTWGQFWNLCTVAGGGSLAFRETEAYYFESESKTLKEEFFKKLPPFVFTFFEEAGIHASDIDCLITHQVTNNTTNDIGSVIGISQEKCVNTYDLFGNTAAATIPVSIDHALQNNQLKKGDKLLIIGLAAGISLSAQLILW